MMKKLVTFMLAVVMVATLLPTQAFAANVLDDYEERLAHNKRILASERTDEYALDFYSLDFDYRNRTIEVTGYVSDTDAIVKEITAGITDEYEKAKAIAEWLSSNMVYVKPTTPKESYAHLPKWQYGICETFASTTTWFYQLAGFPAKEVSGTAFGSGSRWGGHAWNHVFVDGRWVFVDTTWGKFDLPVEAWSEKHILNKIGAAFGDIDWDGTITVYDSSSREKIMTVGPVPIGTPFSKIPELANMKLSADLEGTYPVRPTDKFSSSYMKLYARTHRVSFLIQLDNAYKSLVPHFVREDEYGGLYAYVTVPEGEKLPQVKLPEKAGYTFIGWRDYISPGDPFVNEDTDRVTKDMALIAVFQKGTVNYTVSFNTNGGSAVKAATVKANTKVTKPANPTKSGYKFTGWYLDKDCTEPWDFNTNIVRRNTTLYQ